MNEQPWFRALDAQRNPGSTTLPLKYERPEPLIDLDD